MEYRQASFSDGAEIAAFGADPIHSLRILSLRAAFAAAFSSLEIIFLAFLACFGQPTLVDKVTNQLLTRISLKIAERSEAQIAERSLASKYDILKILIL